MIYSKNKNNVETKNIYSHQIKVDFRIQFYLSILLDKNPIYRFKRNYHY